MKSGHLLAVSIAVIAAAIVVSALLVFDRDGSDNDGSARSDPAASAGDERPAPARQPAAATRRVRRPAVSSADPSTAPASEGPLVEVAIVEGAAGVPVQNAAVWWWPKPSELRSDHGFEAWLRTSTVEDHLDEALELLSDSRGTVRVPDAERGFSVAAACRDLWGCA